MQYLLIIFNDPAELASMDEADQARIMADYSTFTARRKAASRRQCPEPGTATTIRSREGLDRRPLCRKEHRSAYLRAGDLDAAIAMPRGSPGTLGVRWALVS
jgi:hypothetical protein